MTRVLGALLLLVAGVLTALATVAVHERWWGLLLAVGAVATTLLALPPGWWARLPFGAGFGVCVGGLATTRPEGDYLVAGDGPGYVVLLLALTAGVVGVVTLPRPGGGRMRGPVPADIYTDPR